MAEARSEYGFIFLSVRYGSAREAVKTLQENNTKGTLVFFCNFWNTREEIQEWVGEYDYILVFPTTGGHVTGDRLDGVLFDHLVLEGEQEAKIPNYINLATLLISVDLKWEVPHDMVEWIWIHMAINAGVTSTTARPGKLENPEELTLNLMNNSSELSLTIKAIRQALKVVKACGVNLELYKAGFSPYKIPARLARRTMRVMFTRNEVTRKIMTLHNDKQDIFYCYQSIFQTGQESGIEMPILEANTKEISIQKILGVSGRLKHRFHSFRRPETFSVSHIIGTPIKAMILAASRGKHMHPPANHTPKPLLEVTGMPLIGWHLRRLQQVGFTETVINYVWLGQQVEDTLKNGAGYGVYIVYSPERAGDLKTVGGITTTLPFLGSDPFLVINGDVLTDIDLQTARLAVQHIQEHNLLTHPWLVDNPSHHPEGDFGLLSDGLASASSADGQALTFNGVGAYRPVLLKNTPAYRVAELASLLRQAMS